MATKPLCSVPDCGKAAAKREWCGLHYRRWLRHGNPVAGRELNGEPQRYLREVVLAYDGDECLIWPFSKNMHGYGQVYYEGRNQTVHRIVCEKVHGTPVAPRNNAAHSCGNGEQGCVTKGHLSWKTPKGNAEDTVAHGKSLRGDRNPWVKITEDDVLEIYSLRGTALQREIARRYGVTNSLVSKIHCGKAWGWLTGQIRPSP